MTFLNRSIRRSQPCRSTPLGLLMAVVPAAVFGQNTTPAIPGIKSHPEVVELSPFVILEDSNVGYLTNTFSF